MAKKKKEKQSFWKNVWAVIIKKEDTGGQYTKATLVGIMSGVLNALAIILCLFVIAGFVAIVQHICTTDWGVKELVGSNIVACVVVCLFCVVALIFALVLRGFANEIGREKKINNIVSMFSALTSFAALAVAFVALLWEVSRRC